jgi:hypothetical protein
MAYKVSIVPQTIEERLEALQGSLNTLQGTVDSTETVDSVTTRLKELQCSMDSIQVTVEAIAYRIGILK